MLPWIFGEREDLSPNSGIDDNRPPQPPKIGGLRIGLVQGPAPGFYWFVALTSSRLLLKKMGSSGARKSLAQMEPSRASLFTAAANWA